MGVTGKSGAEDGEMFVFDWALTEVTNFAIAIELTFENPIMISQGEEPDSVDLAIDLSEFKAKNGYRMSPMVMNIQLPRQMNVDSAAAIESAAATAESASTAAVGTNFLINIMLSASLNQLWSMMNGL